MSNIEEALKAWLNGTIPDVKPISRADQYLIACAKACGCTGLPTPKTRMETLLYLIAEDSHEMKSDAEEISGETFSTLKDAFKKLIDSMIFEIPDTSPIRYYSPVFIYNWSHNIYPYSVSGCQKLKELIIPNLTESGNSSTFKDNPNLERIYAPKWTGGWGPYYEFEQCPKLREATFGSVGFPLDTSITRPSNSFLENTQDFLTITLYVSDDATLPLANSPWGATNATIIYRSATTGEVIPVE